MHECTHPHFKRCENINVYAVERAIICVEGASFLGMRDMPAPLGGTMGRGVNSEGGGRWELRQSRSCAELG